jgi:hypothetical protein
VLRLGSAALVVVILVQTVFFAVNASDTDVPNPPVTHTVGKVAGPTVAALAAGTVPGGGRNGHYLVTWDDNMSLGGRGYSLLLELERRGFHAGGAEINKVGITPHRVVRPRDATAEVHLVSGVAIDAWAKHPGVVRVAYYDPRSRAQLAEFTRVQAEAIRELRAANLGSLSTGIANDNLAVAFDPRIPSRILPPIQRLLALGLPLAVFVGPPPR